MPEKLLSEKDLAVFAKRFREQMGKTRAEIARKLGVSHVSIYRAEEDPGESLTKLRIRIIEECSQFKVTGPVFQLQTK